MKRSIINKISMSLAFLFGVGAIAGVSSALLAKENPIRAEAATGDKITLADILDSGVSWSGGSAKINGYQVDGMTNRGTDCFYTYSDTSKAVTFFYIVPNGKTVSSYTASITADKELEQAEFNLNNEVFEDYTREGSTYTYSLNKTFDPITGDGTTSGGFIYVLFRGYTARITAFSIQIGEPSSPVTITKGTGVKSVYLSETINATSGSNSGTEFANGTTVYGFAVLAKGYNAPSGWTLVSGTANTENAKYRVGSRTAGTSNFGTINASLATYTISYTLNGGSVSGNPTSYNVNNNAITLKNPTKTGYTFRGWTGSNGSTPQTTVTIANGSTGNKSYTANWQVNTYSISYTLNDGALPSGKTNPSTYNVETATFTLNNPQRVGYNFVGWTGSNGSTPQTTVTITKGSTGNKSYTANWTLVQELQTVVDAINNLGGPTNISYPGSKTSLENVELLYNSLSSDLKTVLDNDYKELVDELTDDREAYDSLRNEAINDAISKIDAIDETVSYPGSRDVVFAARDAINALADEDKVNTVVTNLDNYNDALDTYNALKDAAVDAVIEAINNIYRDSEEHVTYPSSQSSIENARTLYEALAPEEKDPSTAVTNYNELTQAESNYASLRGDAISEVIDAINAISKPFDENRESQISNAQSLYGALAESDKDPTYVTNYSSLEDALRADEVADAIEALPTVSDTDEYRALVSGVREQYEALSDDQEAFVPRTSDIYDLLVEKEEAIKVIDAINAIGDVSYPGSEALITAANLAYENYIDSGYNPDYIVNYDVLVKDNDDFYNVDAVAKLIKAIPAPVEDQSYYDAVDIARAAYNALEDDEKQLLIETIFDPATNMTYAEYLSYQGLARDVIEKIDDIDNVTYNAGVDDSLDDIIAAETAYNAIKDNEYVKGIVDSINYQTLVDARTTYDHVDEVADLISALTPIADQSYYDAVDAAEAAYDNLTDDEQAILDAATNVDYEKILADHVAAKEVIEAIDEIGTLTYDGGVNDSLSDIVAAEEAYDAIKDNADVKAIVDSVNHQTLVDDRESYDAVDHTVSLIEEIGEIKNDEETKQDLEEAWEAYNALSIEEQALVQGYNNTYKTLDDDQHVYDALVLIDNIGTVSYDSESEEKINQAREFYDSLTEDQKEQLGDKYIETLVEKENSYASSKKGATAFLIIFLILASLALVGGIFFLVILIKKMKKENNGVKAASVTGLLPFVIFASHYADAQFIVLYVIAGLAVLVWIAILSLVLWKKFKKNEPVLASEGKVEVSKVEEVKVEDAKPEEVVDVKVSEDGDEIVIAKDSSGHLFQIRFVKSFTAKLSQASDEVKDYYNVLKKHVLSYKKANSRISWSFDSINVGREQVLKFAIRGKTLCLFYNLNPEEVDSKYKVEKAESKRYSDVPCLYRIKNDRRCKYAKELIDMIMRKLHIEKGEEPSEDFRIPYEEIKVLLEKGLIKELKVAVEEKVETLKVEGIHPISVEEADKVMSDEKAEALIEEDVQSKKREGKKEVVNIDTLSQNYKDGDVITLDSLIEKGLVSSNVGYVKVLARGTLDKKLTVDLHDYSIQAVKMIVLMGGHAKKIK